MVVKPCWHFLLRLLCCIAVTHENADRCSKEPKNIAPSNSIICTTSPALTINTGAPQGCVLSPFLFTLYNNDCSSPSLLKYSDDTAILALLTDSHSATEFHSTVHFSLWCETNHLHLNINKTKEIILGHPSTQQLFLIYNQIVTKLWRIQLPRRHPGQ